jgi:hypothetical protein
MTSREEPDALSSPDLHDRAVHLAMRHMDIGSLWQLLPSPSVTEGPDGGPGAAQIGVARGAVDARGAQGRGYRTAGHRLRPFYVGYLLKRTR